MWSNRFNWRYFLCVELVAWSIIIAVGLTIYYW